jgi:glyoxylase-like metal-dependent hydrolase (beta-lactamase superfamily II)
VRVEHRTVGVFEENSYLLVDEDTSRGVLIDPGDEADRIIAMVQQAGVTLDAIWLTHAHIDHIGAVAEVKRRFDVPVYLHPMDLPYYTRLSALAADMYGIDFEQPEGPEESLSDRQRLRCGALEFEVMHVPGHAPGLVAFTGHGVSFGGDLLFAGSIGRTDLPLGDAVDMNASLARYTNALPDETTVYPGHGPATTVGREKRTNPFLLGAARPISR